MDTCPHMKRRKPYNLFRTRFAKVKSESLAQGFNPLIVLSLSCGSFPPLAADHSTTTDWSRRPSASAYGPQFSISPFPWTFSTACTQWLPSLRCSAGLDGSHGELTMMDHMHRTSRHLRDSRKKLLTALVHGCGGAPRALLNGCDSHGDPQHTHPSVEWFDRPINRY